MRHQFEGTILVLAAAGASCGPSIAAHEIAFEARAAVGQKFHVLSEGSVDRRITATVANSEAVVEATNVTLAFEADGKVIEIDKTQRPSHVAYTVRRCELIDGDRKTVIARGGASLHVWWAGGTMFFEVDGRPLDDDARRMLEFVIGEQPLGTQSASSEAAREIGESWSASGSAMAKALQEECGFEADAKQLRATATLVEARREAGVPCVVVRSEVRAPDVLPAAGDYPPGFTLESSQLDAESEIVLATDGSRPPLAERTTIDLHATMAGRLGDSSVPAELSISMTRRLSRQTQLAGGAIATVSD